MVIGSQGWLRMVKGEQEWLRMVIGGQEMGRDGYWWLGMVNNG